MSGPPLELARAVRAPCSGRAASPPLRPQRGQITWVTLLLLAAVAGAAYLAVMWGPIYFENYAVKQVVRDYMNQAVKNRDDELLRHNMVAKIRSLSQVDGVDGYGRAVKVPAVAIEEREVSWQRDSQSQPPMLRVSFDYSREVPYPMIDRTTVKVFAVDLSNDLSLPDWGPAR